MDIFSRPVRKRKVNAYIFYCNVSILQILNLIVELNDDFKTVLFCFCLH